MAACSCRTTSISQRSCILALVLSLPPQDVSRSILCLSVNAVAGERATGELLPVVLALETYNGSRRSRGAWRLPEIETGASG